MSSGKGWSGVEWSRSLSLSLVRVWREHRCDPVGRVWGFAAVQFDLVNESSVLLW